MKGATGGNSSVVYNPKEFAANTTQILLREPAPEMIISTPTRPMALPGEGGNKMPNNVLNPPVQGLAPQQEQARQDSLTRLPSDVEVLRIQEQEEAERVQRTLKRLQRLEQEEEELKGLLHLQQGGGVTGQMLRHNQQKQPVIHQQPRGRQLQNLGPSHHFPASSQSVIGGTSQSNDLLSETPPPPPEDHPPSLLSESLHSSEYSSYPCPAPSGLKKRATPNVTESKSSGGHAKDKYKKIKGRFASRNGHSEIDNMDVESQSERSPLSNDRSQARRAATTASSSNSDVPIVYLRKIAMAIFTDLDDETLQREDTETILIVITLLKEAILGILIAFALVSFILFMDHHFLLNLPTARNFRKATFAVMNDKETLQNFEVNAGLKFMEMEEYNSMVSEIEQVANRTKLAGSILNIRSNDLVGMEREIPIINAELQQELSSLGLDKFCDKCMWSPRMKITCGGRVRLLAERYQTEKYQAMMSAMQKESCRSNSVPMMMQDKKQESNELLQDWGSDQEDVQSNGGQRDNVNQGGQSNSMIQVGQSNSMSQSGQRLGRPSNDVNLEDFCGGCTWEAGTTCGKRSTYLNEMHGTDIPDAMAVVMAETKKCTNSFYEEELQKLGGFCGHCEWGVNTKLTCDGRVDYLTYTYRSPLFVAQLSAMEKPSCRLNK
eukprot:CAMPEP_0201903092 /NCGR_PEP_ID=MMETSP0902-20130614/55298_1 /ASSEMBLY_ACC=CAM_ASM_000551 /TAXON_ID=420261 /ORGANISM="Thalassiosira antarctica, Strain CCMP982" /LENGTH=663 /DNA_ID=CAMNT_0048437125 /DNA_START=145 /DNA_END=2136 /DNA_ORIENTATION=-